MSTSDFSFAPPRGMRDFYPADMALRNAIFDAWRRSATRFGFLPYDACVVENLDLLKRKAGEEIVDQIYAFSDKSGRELALRPEMTPSLARMIIARQGSLPLPLKWYAVAQCFRYERMSKGRKREHFQWNLDIVGENSLAAEVEILSAAADALQELGLGPGDYNIHFNSRALLADLLVASGIAAALHPACFLALDKRGKIPDDEIRLLLEQNGVSSADADRLFGVFAIGSLQEVRDRLGTQTPSLAAVESFAALGEQAGLGPVLRFDLSVIRGLSYYTGIVFEAFDAQRRFRAIFGGGRYDNLLSDIGGVRATAVGLGFGDVVVADLLAELQRLPHQKKTPLDVAVGFMDETQRSAAVRVARALRQAGQNIDLALSPEKAKHFFSRTGKGEFAEAVYIGPDDVTRGSVRIKKLDTRTEREMAIPAA
jgi:histidyl-tRNA synthetase